MNKDLLNQLPADEQPVASKLNSLADDMHISQTFKWELETQLMDKAKKKTRPIQGWHVKILPTLGWAVLALSAVFLLNWTIRSLASDTLPVAGGLPGPDPSFAASVSQGEICRGPLAAVHGFTGFLTNQDITGFVLLDEQRTLDEVRSTAWSPDGTQLAIVGNTTGQGSVLITGPAGGQLEYLLYSSELGYLLDAAWSRDGKQLVTWSGQNNTVVHLLKTDGTSPVKKQLDKQVLGTPQFAPDGESILFYGADSSSMGLFEAMLDSSETRLISAQVKDESGFAFSPDGSRLAYMEMDRDLGEARLVAEDIVNGGKTILGTLSIPKGSGSSLPETADLSWSTDGKILAFEFGGNAAGRAIYLAYTDGTELVKIVDSAHAPAISADGKCLAYIHNNQVFLLDLADVSPSSTTATPLLLADLPAGRASGDFRLDKLKWRPRAIP
jgi:Tol biopolymer transport system component